MLCLPKWSGRFDFKEMMFYSERNFLAHTMPSNLIKWPVLGSDMGQRTRVSGKCVTAASSAVAEGSEALTSLAFVRSLVFLREVAPIVHS